MYLALPRHRLASDLIAEDDEDSASDGEGKKNDDTDGDVPSKNFAILLVEKFIYEDPDHNSYLEVALNSKGRFIY